jgi:Uma2 family endonuclease
MSSLPEYRISPEEYLRLERAAESKSEYDDGLIYAMAGNSIRHNFIVAGLIQSLGKRLPPRCGVIPSDMKVRILNPTRFYYPDVSVVCGPPRFADDQTDVLLNPLIVFEVLSDSTALFDRGRKFLSYQTIDSLHEYVLVSQDLYLVEHYRRDGDHWIYTAAQGRDAGLTLPAVECELPLDEIYYQVEIAPAETTEAPSSL